MGDLFQVGGRFLAQRNESCETAVNCSSPHGWSEVCSLKSLSSKFAFKTRLWTVDACLCFSTDVIKTDMAVLVKDGTRPRGPRGVT